LEVNRRVAAHMSHKAPFANESARAQENRFSQRSRAAQAAARVAERYAHAPSYSELLAGEARNAMRAAEAASQAAQQAQAAVQYVLDGLEAAATPELGQRTEFEAEHTPEPREGLELISSDRAQNPRIQAMPEDVAEAIEHSNVDDPGEPIYPNLIQFPRPMVATRRMRPRRAEGPLAAAHAESQLSIFEVDPLSVSTEATTAVDQPAAPVWMRTEESRIEIEPQPEERPLEEARPRAAQSSIRVAPLSFRLMALVVDASLTLAGFLSLAMLIVSRVSHLPGLRAVELAMLLGLFAAGAAYQALFLVLATATPGMRYAGIALTDFEGKCPSREQRSIRLSALALSIAPLGLGLVWALFDEDGLMGHDRLSKTYLRKR
jgi:uncharacterized RDD family membrane protein YckC